MRRPLLHRRVSRFCRQRVKVIDGPIVSSHRTVDPRASTVTSNEKESWRMDGPIGRKRKGGHTYGCAGRGTPQFGVPLPVVERSRAQYRTDQPVNASSISAPAITSRLTGGCGFRLGLHRKAGGSRLGVRPPAQPIPTGTWKAGSAPQNSLGVWVCSGSAAPSAVEACAAPCRRRLRRRAGGAGRA